MGDGPSGAEGGGVIPVNYTFAEAVEDVLTCWSTPDTTPEEREAMRPAAEDHVTDQFEKLQRGEA